MYRSMLAAAHVLAMDAKNLLDVVDCIRERHPHIDWRAALREESPTPTPTHPTQTVTHPTPTPTPPTLAPQGSLETETKPDFKINQPVTTGTTHFTDHTTKEHNSLPITSNRVSTLIQNYNLYGNVREQHIYGNEPPPFQHSQSCDDSKIDIPIDSVKSRVQAIAKIDSPPIYSISKKMIDHSDQG